MSSAWENVVGLHKDNNKKRTKEIMSRCDVSRLYMKTTGKPSHGNEYCSGRSYPLIPYAEFLEDAIITLTTPNPKD